MKKITYFLSFLLMFLGVSTANAEVGDVITNLNQLSDTKFMLFRVQEQPLCRMKQPLRVMGKPTPLLLPLQPLTQKNSWC